MKTLSEFLKEDVEIRKLDKKIRQRANDKLNKAGFDGNGRFKRPDRAMTQAQKVLDEFGIDISTIIGPYTLPGEKGSTNLDIVFHNDKDPFSPIQISNSMFHVSWTQLKPNYFEIVAYLS